MTTEEATQRAAQRLIDFPVEKLAAGERRQFRQSLDNLIEYLDKLQRQAQSPRRLNHSQRNSFVARE